MKNAVKIIVSIALLSTIVFSRYQVHSSETKQKSLQTEVVEAKENYPEIYNHINSITYDQFKKDVSSGEDFYVYVGRPTCGDCNDFEPALIKLIQDNQLGDKIVYLNVAEVRKDEPSWELFKEVYGIQYTPTIAKFIKGKLETKVEWTPEKGISTSAVESWMIKNIR